MGPGSPDSFYFLNSKSSAGFIFEMSGNLWMISLCLCVSWADAHIWAWMLNMPHSPPKEGAKAFQEQAPVARAATVRYCRILCIDQNSRFFI